MNSKNTSPGLLLALAFLAPAILTGCSGSEETGEELRFVTIGTGGVTGVYYPVGGAIATMLNDHAENIQASAESTGGSVFNINAVLAGDLYFGFAQGDRQYQASNGEAEWSDQGPRKNLRAVCSFYTEMVNLVAAADAGIETLKDLEGKRVNIGNPGSGTRINSLAVLEAAGLDPEEDVDTEEIKSSESATLLQDGRIDAYFFTAGHPAGSFMEASAGRRTVRFVPITGLENLIEKHPFYTEAKIPLKHYPDMANDGNVQTLGIRTTLVTSADVSEDTVYQLVKAIAENLPKFKKQHAALEPLTKEKLLEGLSAPLHQGARKYYEEIGLID